MFRDYQMSLSSSYDSFDVDALFPHAPPSSYISEAFSSKASNLGSESELSLHTGFEDLVNWDSPSTCMLEGGESLQSPQSLPEQNENDIFNSPIESPVLYRPDDCLEEPKPFEPLTMGGEARSDTVEIDTQASPTDAVSPVPSPKTRRKRKSSDSSGSDSSSPRTRGRQPKYDRISHNMIEKRYRNRLNDKISSLRNVVPSLRGMVDSDEPSPDGLSPALKVNKGTILSKTVECILDFEKQVTCLSRENQMLKVRIGAFERLLMAPETVGHFMESKP